MLGVRSCPWNRWQADLTITRSNALNVQNLLKRPNDTTFSAVKRPCNAHSSRASQVSGEDHDVESATHSRKKGTLLPAFDTLIQYLVVNGDAWVKAKARKYSAFRLRNSVLLSAEESLCGSITGSTRHPYCLFIHSVTDRVYDSYERARIRCSYHLVSGTLPCPEPPFISIRGPPQRPRSKMRKVQ